MEITQQADAYIIGDVTLSKTKWDIMNYGAWDTNVVSFPGEYDIAWLSVKCIDAGDMLHYVLHFEDNSWVAILQSSAALEKESIDGINTRYVADESIQKEIENLELEWEIKILA